MTAQMKTNASAKKAVKSPSHIFDTFIVWCWHFRYCRCYRLDQVGYTNYKIIEKAGRVGGHGVKIPIQVVVVMYLLLFTLIICTSAKWSHLFARQPEILSYLEDVSNEFNVTSKIELIASC